MSPKFWEILLVDDNTKLHELIKNNLNGILINKKKVKILHAYNAAEAKELIGKNSDIAIAFIDIAMQAPDAGLELVNYIRNTLYNTSMRIIIIDSESLPVPASDIIEHYDINDYKDQRCIESQKLFTTIRTAIKQYQQFKDLKDKKDQIYKKMTTNEITSLPNRMKLTENIDTVGGKSLILINIDDFSLINNYNGFEFGDDVLRVFADFLVYNYAKFAEIYHLEADIFALFCLRTDTRTQEQSISIIKENISHHEFSVNGIKIHLTASLGAVLNEYGNVIQKAEFALKEARLYGKNNARKYSDDLQIVRTIHSNSIWTGRIRKAIAHNKILAYFQPIQNLKTGKIEKYETLVRLEYDKKIYSPFHFLDAALYSGQMFKIFKIMLSEACKKAQTTSYIFGVNISEYDLKHPKFVQTIHEIMKQYSVTPNRIVFEILENNSIARNKNIQDVLNVLHEDGFKLAIDDFGADCSNFAQLNNLPINFIKIDGQFIKNIVKDRNSQITAKTILDYAHQKEIPVVAEFVCSKEVYDYVKEMGVDFVQGYEIAEPKPILLD
ncbi:EAL domain-containing response regulator [Sulfurimonas autotrophica]|uniref:Response regulator receiver modulated diguanylate cyclase/phosphodiesterase n=1 Tax=Sulfurimonas autotrophica (strain ATCC BAA-671 / DSM 16294 / JCM 11897 / OK10) TaxID=563040 RepID=E0UR41_SULAO|nr:EAL domain-containing protein [Sulfurimonas autotrophica]ADN09997.1 response regulator receiver modulated diguanylate cyclase/phosphodiesterase [Sulfurimonas autotrophica DSM 16294]